MEASFQADKRQLKQEVEELHQRLAQRDADVGALQQQLAESRARVITQQHERAQETGDHATQLRELQRILQQERDLRQDAELRLQDANAALLANTQAVERGAESEAHLSQVSQERDELKEKLLASERHHKKPDPRLDELQQELAHLKKNFQTQSDIQTKKASEAEQRATERAQCAERRAAGLEQRVSELSELLGGAERARHREQTAAQRLRDRVLQLDHENKMLAKAMTSDLGLENKMLAKAVTSDLGVDESQLDVGVLKEKLENVKKMLQLAAKVDPEHSTQDEVQDIQNLQVQNLQKGQDIKKIQNIQKVQDLEEERGSSGGRKAKRARKVQIRGQEGQEGADQGAGGPGRCSSGAGGPGSDVVVSLCGGVAGRRRGLRGGGLPPGAAAAAGRV
ncbi:hypothetical protein FQN60_016022 [Etheostoma spectabile]|uniref:Uncharacterized protein n=1 Tax=Etheostoma spectabile TaxID=54343 RepID=A0A5J5C8L3_9PERO|nr:hypothetical protein FQN60_016022 [Etheostoma spectabile]